MPVPNKAATLLLNRTINIADMPVRVNAGLAFSPSYTPTRTTQAIEAAREILFPADDVAAIIRLRQIISLIRSTPLRSLVSSRFDAAIDEDNVHDIAIDKIVIDKSSTDQTSLLGTQDTYLRAAVGTELYRKYVVTRLVGTDTLTVTDQSTITYPYGTPDAGELSGTFSVRHNVVFTPPQQATQGSLVFSPTSVFPTSGTWTLHYVCQPNPRLADILDQLKNIAIKYTSAESPLREYALSRDDTVAAAAGAAHIVRETAAAQAKQNPDTVWGLTPWQT